MSSVTTSPLAVFQLAIFIEFFIPVSDQTPQLPKLLPESRDKVHETGCKCKNFAHGSAPDDDPLNRGSGASDRGTMPTLRKCTGNKDRAVLPASTSRADEEYNVLAALQGAFNLAEVFRGVHLLLIDFEDDIAPIQADVVGE